MDFKIANRITAFFVFAFSAVIYLMTVQPTFSFWDCGEFIASAYTLSVPHPPGAPFFLLMGKIFTMIPFAEDIGYRMNLLSVFSGAFTVLLLYMVLTKVLINWKGKPADLSAVLTICGASMVGALSYAFSETFWFNALEAEVYGLGTLLIALCVYLLMVWWEKADEKGSDKYLIMVAYIVGLSIGIHLIVVQCIVIAGLMFYFKRYKYSLQSLIIAIGLSMTAFFLVYPFIVKKLPALMSGSFLAGIVIVVGLAVGVYYSIRKKSPVLNFAFLSVFLIILGYTTYISVIQRSNVANLPLDENNPDNIESLLSYLNREQYGEQPLVWPRRYSQEPQHTPTWQNYTSDFDFMWRYQINHMFNRYLFWNYGGRESHEQDAGTDFSKLFAIPLLLGLFGLYYHFRKDKKLALVFLAMFILMGVVTALYQNQQQNQPRERDYFYVGAFFAFSLWIGVGTAGIIELLSGKIKAKTFGIVSAGIVTAAFLLVPINMLRVNYFYQDRSENYFSYDYAYNLLQSVEKDAILFTNTDNDTFPVWCLQAVYGVRQDVRIIQLSLAQTDWYNLQLKNESPYGALKVPYTMSDMQIVNNRGMEWQTRPVTFDVTPSAYPDTMQSKPGKVSITVPGRVMRQGGQNFSYLGPNDVITLDIIKANKWERPIYFANTVGPESLLGMEEYVQLEGMAQKLLPYKTTGINMDITRQCLFNEPSGVSKTPAYGFKFRGLNNKDIFYDGPQKNMMQSYRPVFIRLAQSYAMNPSTYALADDTLRRMDEAISPEVAEIDYRLNYDIAMIYSKTGNSEKFLKAAGQVENEALADIAKNPANIRGYYNPYRILLDIYEVKKEYGKGIDILNRLSVYAPNDPSLKEKISLFKLKLTEK